MRAFLSALSKAGAGVSFLALLVLIALVWFGGMLLDWSPTTRFIIISVLLLAWIALYVVQRVMAVRSAMLIEKRLRAQAQEHAQSVRPDKKPEVEALEKQLTDALATLKNSKLGKGALYALPWYVIIGPPGCGKTTALQESGLNFPVMSGDNRGIRGVGGTRNCDWWFTDEGILLDTAGRYTTQMEDRDEWLSFLDMVKRCRKHKPINGAIVAIAVSDLINASDEEIEKHAKNVRDRLDEFTKHLEMVYPVYLLFTKCDLLHGFVEFFEDYTKSERAQVWGRTLTYDQPGGQIFQDLFDAECSRLYESLCTQRVASLAAERPSDKKQAIFQFPIQWKLAQKRLGDFIGALFRPNPFQEQAVFRGFYFTSGTQEGAPIDQILASMREAMGQGETEATQEDIPSVSAAPANIQKKSYFLNNLFTKIIFPDQNLARSTMKVEKRRTLARWATIIGSGVGLLLFMVLLLVSCAGNSSLLGDVEEAGANFIEVKEKKSDNIEAQMEALDDLRKQIKRLDDNYRGGAPISIRWGLYTGNSINSAARKLYLTRLYELFVKPASDDLSNVIWGLLKKKKKEGDDFRKLVEYGRVIQMLGAALPAEPDLVMSVLSEQDRWLKGLGKKPKDLSQTTIRLAKAQLEFFVTQMYEPKHWPIYVDPKIVEQIQWLIVNGPAIPWLYNNIMEQYDGSLEQITTDTFVTSRGRKLLFAEKPLSGLFQQEGYDRFLSIAFRDQSRSQAKVVQELAKKDISPEQIEKQLVEIYIKEYQRSWREFLDSIRVKPFDNMIDASDKLKLLAGAESPFKELFEGIWRRIAVKVSDGERDITHFTPNDNLAWLEDANKALLEFSTEVTKFVSKTERESRVFPYFREGKLDTVAEAFATGMGKITTAAQGADPDLRKRAESILGQPVHNTRDALIALAQKEANKIWKENVQSFYAKEMGARYPFKPAATEEVTVATFAELFNAKTGKFWIVMKEFNGLKKKIVDERPLLSFSPGFEETVRVAENIRDAMFPTDGEKVSVAFTVDFKGNKSPGVAERRLTLGGENYSEKDFPNGRGIVEWLQESPKGMVLAIRIDQDLWAENKKYSEQEWGLLRLVKEGNPQADGDRAFKCEWVIEARLKGVLRQFSVKLGITGKNRINPFTEGLFTSFKCPETLGK